MEIECIHIVTQAMKNHFEITVSEVDNFVGINVIREHSKRPQWTNFTGTTDKQQKECCNIQKRLNTTA